jgi:hypothetical protein
MAVDPSRTLTISIDRPPDKVAAFIRDPRNLPAWAAGLGGSVRQHDGKWLVSTPDGEVRIRFVEPNTLGVIDHWVQVAHEVEVHVPMRVLPNASGSEVLFTLFQPATMPAAKFAEDLALVEKDLASLKRVLELNSVA